MRIADKTKIQNELGEIITPASDVNLEKLIGFEIPKYDEIALTYITTGNGTGELGTVEYKENNVTVATLTLTYDSANKVINVKK